MRDRLGFDDHQVRAPVRPAPGQPAPEDPVALPRLGRFIENQHFKRNRQSLLTAMERASQTHSNKSIATKHRYEDGSTVIAHSLVTRPDPAANDIAVAHTFR
jgi:hypothetical protein